MKTPYQVFPLIAKCSRRCTLPLIVEQSCSDLCRLRQTEQDIGLKSEGQSLSLGLIKGLESIIRHCGACVGCRTFVLPILLTGSCFLSLMQGFSKCVQAR